MTSCVRVVLWFCLLSTLLAAQDFGPPELGAEARALLERPEKEHDFRLSGEIGWVFAQMNKSAVSQALQIDEAFMGNHKVWERSDRRFADNPEWFYNEISLHRANFEAPHKLAVYMTLRVNGSSPKGAQESARSWTAAYELNTRETRALGDHTVYLERAFEEDGGEITEVHWFADDGHLEIKVTDGNKQGAVWEVAKTLHLALEREGLYDARAKLLAWKRDGAPAPSAEPQLDVSLVLLDEGGDADAQLTPADRVELEIVVKLAAGPESLEDPRVELTIDNAFCAKQSALRLTGPRGGDLNCRILLPSDDPIPRGGELRLKATLHTASGSNRWIEEQLFKGLAQPGTLSADRKPAEELSVSLEGLLRVRVLARSGDDPGASSEQLFDEAVPLRWKHADREVRISYPDLREAVGEPEQATASQRDYYRRGDVLGGSPGDPFLRGLALRAARYGAGGGAAPKPRAGGWESGAPEFPEDDPNRVVANVAAYVHAAMWPKIAPEDLFLSRENARAFWLKEYGFGELPSGSSSAKDSFICQEHSQLFGSLLRALGFSVREMNIMTHPMFGWRWQDAASEVWVEGDWQWWGLFTGGEPTRTHRDYGLWYMAYEVVAGTQRFDERGGEIPTRFNIGDEFWFPETAWKDSPYWDYVGYGDNNSFVEADRPPRGAKLLPFVSSWVMFEVFSPVSVVLELGDGRRVGLRPVGGLHAAEPSVYLPGAPRLGVINEVPGALAWPAGLVVHADASDPASAQVMTQSIAVPAELYAEGAATLTLTGTASGPYAVRRLELSADGSWREFRGVEGVAAPGETRVVAASDFRLHATGSPGERPSERVPHAAEVAGEDTPPEGPAPDVAVPDAPAGRRVGLVGVSLLVPEGWVVGGSVEDAWLALRPKARGTSQLILRATKGAPGLEARALHEARTRRLAGLGYREVSRVAHETRIASELREARAEFSEAERRAIDARRAAHAMSHQLGTAGPAQLPAELPALLRLVSVTGGGVSVRIELRGDDPAALDALAEALDSLRLPESDG